VSDDEKTFRKIARLVHELSFMPAVPFLSSFDVEQLKRLEASGGGASAVSPVSMSGLVGFTWHYDGQSGIYVSPDYELHIRALALKATGVRGSFLIGHAITLSSPVTALGLPGCAVTDELAAQLAQRTRWEQWELRALVPTIFGAPTTLGWVDCGDAKGRCMQLPTAPRTGVGALQRLMQEEEAAYDVAALGDGSLTPDAPRTWSEREERAAWVLRNFTPGEKAKLYRTLHEGENLRLHQCRDVERREKAELEKVPHA
jgi:hypothetical protein